MVRVGIVGAGGIGGALGAALADTREVEVVFCVRRAFATLSVRRPGSAPRTTPARCVTRAEEAGPLDWILLCTKAHHVADAAPWLELAASAPAARVAILQNGVEHVDRVRRWVPADRALPAIAHFAASATAPGVVDLTNPGPIEVPDGPLGQEFSRLCSDPDLPIVETRDFVTTAWRKLAHNVPASAITAAMLTPVHALHAVAGLRELARELALETILVGRAEGATLDATLVDEIIQLFGRLPHAVTTSMFQDRMRGKTLEHDALLGAVLRAAARHRLDTPAVRRMSSVLEWLSARPTPLEGS